MYICDGGGFQHMGACQPSAHDDLHTSIPLINVAVEIYSAWPSFHFRFA
jgi:hypothetical protein